MEIEFITDQADVRLNERYVPDDAAQHSDLLHISLCKALYELTALRSRLVLLEKVAEAAKNYIGGDYDFYLLEEGGESHRICLQRRSELRAALDAAKEVA